MDAANAIPLHVWDSGANFLDGDLFTKIAVDWVRRDGNLCNSHSCPKGGVQNWGGQRLFADGTPKPTGYPGRRLSLNGSLQRNKKNNGSYPYGALFNIVGICTGSGGGGNESFNYDAKIWAQDWPGAASAETFQRLVGK